MSNTLRFCHYCGKGLPSNLIPRHESGCISSSPSLERLYEIGRVTREGDCIVWNGKRRPDGYGILTGMSSEIIGSERANRVALMLSTGITDPSLHALHSCDNPPCINPDHLRWGNPKENHQDSVDRNRDSSPPPRQLLPREEVECPICGTKFERPVGGKKRTDETCSRSCGAALAFQRRDPEWVSPLRDRVERTCPICGKVDLIKKSYAAKHPTCSAACGRKWAWVVRRTT